jgi:predicted phosphodiesterase
MKYALILDIHGNLPAMEAVLADIDERGDVDVIYHLGDLGGYAPWPNEVVALLRERGVTGIAGNYDSTVATDYEHCGCKAETPPSGRALSPQLRVDQGARLPRDQALSRYSAL